MTNQRVKLPQPLRNLVVTVLAVCAIGACGGGGVEARPRQAQHPPTLAYLHLSLRQR